MTNDTNASAKNVTQFGGENLWKESEPTILCRPWARGGGAAEAAGVSADVDVHVGTLSKAAGSHGGFVACSSRMRAALVNHGRPFVFSTSLPVPVVAGALAAIRIACTEVSGTSWLSILVNSGPDLRLRNHCVLML